MTSYLLGTAVLVVWGDVDSSQVDESSLNGWWTNEHLPERLSIPGFLRARRYYSHNDADNHTKYLTWYEVSDLDTLTSPAYMEKLDKPTAATQQHLPTLATMNRSATRIVCSEVRRDLQPVGTGVGGTVAMFVLSLPPNNKTGDELKSLLSRTFSAMQNSDKSVMNFNLLQEDRAVTEPGSTTQSYLNVNLKPTENDSLVKWIILFEFSTSVRQHPGIEKLLEPVREELSAASSKSGRLTLDLYELLCSVRNA